ncbi:Crp/Fnr family transcriptional regulator [Pleionea sediminis]|uniref:Crp/Fnr family transcriptional regulator n=1 Tax=Pleionea sediminis TaxID=2569479 RepID=UPI001184C4EE|nr:Crp/Fnr family transcriptional regulator [Pleionea sediminis]
MVNVIPQSFNEIQHLLPSLKEVGKKREFKKNDFICRAGDKVTHLFYIVSGLVKCFQVHDGKEVILRILSDNSAAFAYSAFLTDSLSLEYIECMQDCQGVLISLTDLQRAREKKPEINRLYQFMAEQHYLSMERRLIMLHHKSAKERYRFFCEHMDDKVVTETPKNCIASYLGITPESFSRIKRELNN